MRRTLKQQWATYKENKRKLDVDLELRRLRAAIPILDIQKIKRAIRDVEEALPDYFEVVNEAALPTFAKSSDIAIETTGNKHYLNFDGTWYRIGDDLETRVAALESMWSVNAGILYWTEAVPPDLATYSASHLEISHFED